MSDGVRDERLDRAIDAALRQMAGGDGPADMRGRVLARLAEPPRRAASRAPVLAVAVVILIALALAVWRVGRSGPTPAVTTAQRHAPAVLPSTPSPPTRSPEMTPAAQPMAARLHVVRTRPPAPAVPPEPDDASIDGMEPIDVAPLVVTPLETPLLALAPLSLEPMQIAPLEQSLPEQP